MVIKRAWHLFIPLIALVSLLLLDCTPFLAAFWRIILSIVCSYIPPLARRVGLGELEGDTLTPRRWVKAFEEGAKSALAIGAVCACVGLFLGTLTLSGLGFKFSGAVSIYRPKLRSGLLPSISRTMVGRLLAQLALGSATEVSLAPYALERFASGRLLRGRYGSGAIL